MIVDDGFAGGVCRCSACGTIQTVPARGQVAVGGQSIFERASRGGPERDALAEEKPATPQAARRQRSLISAGVGAAVALAIGAGVVLHMRGGGSTKDAEGATPDDAAAPRAISGPSFGPIGLKGSGPIVYLVDRGDATRAYTASLQYAVLRSVATLGTGRKFQVRYWTADGESPAFPPTPGDADLATVARLGPWMAEVAGGRATDASASLDAALASKPAEIIILTGKAWQLDDAFANEAMVKLISAEVRVHAVALGGTSGNTALARITAKTGGTFVSMNEAMLVAIGK
jgi:hypothetical protein